MNPRQRMMAAIRRQPVDRLPASPILFFMVPMQASGVSAWQIEGLEDPKLPLWQARLIAYRKYGLDGWLKEKLPYRYPIKSEERELSRSAERIEVEYVQHTAAGDLRQKYVFPRHDASWEVEYLVKDPSADAPKLKALLKHDPVKHADPAEVAKIVAGAAGDAIVSVQVATTLDWWLSLRGPQDGILDIMDHGQAAWFRELWELRRAQMLGEAEAAARTAADLIYICSGYTSLSIVSPQWWEEHIIPEVEQICKIAHARGKPVCVMCNGRSNAILEMVADTGAEAISPLERPPLGDVDIGDAARRVAKKLCLVGNVDPVNTMLKGTPEQLDAEIRGIIEDTGLKTGLIVSTSDQVPLGVSEAMLHRFREAVKAYGTVGKS